MFLSTYVREQSRKRVHSSCMAVVETSDRNLLDNRICTFKLWIHAFTGHLNLGIVLLQAFTSCTLGVEHVGFIMICYGIGCSVSSFVFTRLTHWTGYSIPFIIGESVSLSLSLYLL